MHESFYATAPPESSDHTSVMFTTFHNKDFSDVDLHIQDLTREDITPEEFESLCGLLKHDPRVDSFERGSKALRLEVFGMDVDVVCRDLFDGDSQLHRQGQINKLKQLYTDYPGARNAARVAKWLFRDLKGLDVEHIVNDLARDSKKLWRNRQKDYSGLQLFEKVVIELGGPAQSRYSSLRELKRKALSQRGNTTTLDLDKALARSQVLATSIHEMRKMKSHSSTEELQSLEDLPLRCLLIQYKCLGGTPRPDGGASIQVLPDMSLCPEGANLGASIAPDLGTPRKTKSEALSPKPQLRIDGGAGSSDVGISSISPTSAQSYGRGRGRRGTSSESQPQRMFEQVVLIFDDMLCC
ncbi:unnamed protein product [Symbiodinium sp. CCMP2592]|nr:unnamed protein product [Symbiodinium sp. CCMP2592]